MRRTLRSSGTHACPAKRASASSVLMRQRLLEVRRPQQHLQPDELTCRKTQQQKKVHGGGGTQRAWYSKYFRGKRMQKKSRSAIFKAAAQAYRQWRAADPKDELEALAVAGKAGTVSHRAGGSAFGYRRTRSAAHFAPDAAVPLADTSQALALKRTLQTAPLEDALQILSAAWRSRSGSLLCNPHCLANPPFFGGG